MYAAIIISIHVHAHYELTKHVPCSLSDYVEASLMLQLQQPMIIIVANCPGTVRDIPDFCSLSRSRTDNHFFVLLSQKCLE